jgi:hypothetical protein
MGRKRYGDGAQRKVGRAYVRGPRWNAAQFYFVRSVIEHVLACAPTISLARIYREICYQHQSWSGFWMDPSHYNPDELSNLAKLMLTLPAEDRLNFHLDKSERMVKIGLPSRSAFYRYVRWPYSPGLWFQLLRRADSGKDQPWTRVLSQPDMEARDRERALFQMDYTLMDLDGTVLFDSTNSAPAPEEPAPTKLYLPGLAIVENVNAHCDGNILRIESLWLRVSYPDGSYIRFLYTGQGIRPYYRDMSLN